MCTRFALERAAARAGFARLGLDALAAAVDAAAERFNIAPGGPVDAVRAAPARSGSDSASAVFRPRWGLHLSGSSLPASRSLLVNARAESLALKPTFRDAFRRRRCLVPATGFYEWEKRGRARLPWFFRLRDGAPFAFAALWEPLANDGLADAAAVVVTTAPNAVMAPIHDRMPALLATAEACRAWLDPRATEAGLAALLAPAPAAGMTATPVSPRVNRADVDDPACLAPAVHGVAARDDEDELALGF